MPKLFYFNGKLTQGFVALFTGRMIQFVASGLTGLFVPIFLLKVLNFSIPAVFLYFLSAHLAYPLILPYFAQLLNRIGFRRSLRVSLIFDAGFYVSLFFMDYNRPFFIFLSLVFLILGRLTFWLPFHVDFAKFTDKLNRCKEVSLVWATKSFLSIIMPLVSGFLITIYGFNVIFVLAIILTFITLIPFLALPRTKEKFEWTYGQTVKNFFAKENRKMILANMANGAENEVGLVIWPIFIWQIMEKDYLAVGAISSMIVFITVILQLAVGKYADTFNKRKLLHWGSAFYAAGWMAKIFVMTAFQTFVIGAYHSFAQIFKDTPFDSLNYELLADHGHYVDEYTVLKEMAVQYGKVLILLFAIIVVATAGLNWTFALAALASLLINFL